MIEEMRPLSLSLVFPSLSFLVCFLLVCALVGRVGTLQKSMTGTLQNYHMDAVCEREKKNEERPVTTSIHTPPG
jgi:hypothetical protein